MTDDVPDVVTDLRDAGSGSYVRVTTDDGEEYTLYLVDVEYIPYGDHEYGHFRAIIELDADVHDVPGEYPSESGSILSGTDYSGEWRDVSLSVWDPEVDDDDYVIEDDYLGLGMIVSVEKIDD